MRKSIGWMVVGIAAAGIAAQAFAQSVRIPTPGSNQRGSNGGSSVRAGGDAVSPQALSALAALGASDRTLAGPGTMQQPSGDDEARIYRVQSGPVPDVCVTVLNIGNSAPVRILVPGEPETGSAIPGGTVTRCFAAPAQIDLRCADNQVCSAIWRVDAVN